MFYLVVCGFYFEFGLICFIYQNFQWFLKYYVYIFKDKGLFGIIDKLLKYR